MSIYIYAKLKHILNDVVSYLNLDTALCLYFDPVCQRFALHITEVPTNVTI